jgi:hypothetical protein
MVRDQSTVGHQRKRTFSVEATEPQDGKTSQVLAKGHLN